MAENWFNIGKEAGKKDGWMRLDKSILEETYDMHPDYSREPSDLVQTAIEGWEETDHFEIKYGSGMGRNEDREFDPDQYSDDKSEFWEGFMTGSKSQGQDVYKLAKQVIAGKTRASKSRKLSTKRKSIKRSSSTPTSTRGLR